MSMKYKLLYIDDDNENLEVYKEALSDNFTVTILNSPLNVLEVLDDHFFDAIIIDLHMPFIDGFKIINSIKHHPVGLDIPLFLFSSDNTNQSRINGLKAGVVDYLYKLSHIDEIKLRIKNGIESTKVIRPILSIGNLTLDQNFFTTSINKVEVPLTLTEYKMLCFLMTQKKNKLNNADLQKYLYHNRLVTVNTLRVHFTNLKKKLGLWDHDILYKSGEYVIIDKANS